jgi:hypothetical protein
LAEVGFAAIANQGRAMMARANIPENMKYRVYSEAFMTATLLDGLIPIEIDGIIKPRIKHWSGDMPAYAKHLRTWGEAGMVTIKSPMMPKVRDRGVQCMIGGYAVKHPGDTYCMWDPATGGIHETHDIIWLRRM